MKSLFQPPTEDEIFSKERVLSEIDVGLLQMQILWILSRKPCHGYELMKDLNSIKSTKITQGTLYPTLKRLVQLKLVASADVDNKKVYHITDKGKKTMDQACTDFTRTFFGIFHDYVCGKCVERDVLYDIGKK
jgi:DNA-binding MarR family transcriptional regulator